MRLEETNASEPLMTCRNILIDAETGIGLLSREQGLGGGCRLPNRVRHEGGVTLRQASIRNTGTCRSDAKGETQVASRREGQSTEAEHRGGDVRSREEGPVMGLDRRGVVIRLDSADNPKGEDPRE